MYFLGRFSIKDVVPSKEGESSKIKVKVRLSIHGILNVVNASLVEKLAVVPDPEEESMEVEEQDEKAKETTGTDAATEVGVLSGLIEASCGYNIYCNVDSPVYRSLPFAVMQVRVFFFILEFPRSGGS